MKKLPGATDGFRNSHHQPPCHASTHKIPRSRTPTPTLTGGKRQRDFPATTTTPHQSQRKRRDPASTILAKGRREWTKVASNRKAKRLTREGHRHPRRKSGGSRARSWPRPRQQSPVNADSTPGQSAWQLPSFCLKLSRACVLWSHGAWCAAHAHGPDGRNPPVKQRNLKR